jgi:hypothetical protein
MKIQSKQSLKEEMMSVARGERKAPADAAQVSIEPNERWLHEPAMKEQLARADKWMKANPAKETAYEIDDGQLTDADINHIRKAAEPMLPKGKVIKEKSLLVRNAIARMEVAPRAFNQEEWDALASYEGQVVSGDPKGPVPGNLKADDNE